jgi:hypothetical protein
MMDTKFTTSIVPSKARVFLRRFIGNKITRLVRYSWWPAEEVGNQFGIKDELVFSLTAGPLAVYFEDGSILGVASDPSLNSVVVWDEAAISESQSSTSLDKDDELFAISESGKFASDHWRRLLGMPLNSLIVLKKNRMSVKEREQPSEVGLRFNFEGNNCFIASHGLHNNSDDFSVLDLAQLSLVDLKEIPLC